MVLEESTSFYVESETGKVCLQLYDLINEILPVLHVQDGGQLRF